MRKKYFNLSNIKINAFLFFVFINIGLHGCYKDVNDPEPIVLLPEITVHNIEIGRTKKQESGRFFIEMNNTSKSDVAFDFIFSDGSAKENTDFLHGSGTVKIPAGQISTSIEFFIIGNSLREPNLDFYIVLSNPKNCILKNTSATCKIITINGEDIITSNMGYNSLSSYAGKKMVWNQEFEDNTLKTNEWNQEIGNGIGGWGNNELQYYTNSKKNTFVSNGHLIIEARKEIADGFQYTSGRLTTKGKKEFTFGRIDIRAKLPKGKGIWPALWMLGANINMVGWPACGEIDIMELIGSEPNKVHGTLHWKGSNGHKYKGKEYILPIGDFSEAFHVYSVIWEQDKIQWLVDDKVFYMLTKSDFGSDFYPFNAPQFFIFNLAVGGNWPGLPDASTLFPQHLFVDYIRVFQ